MYYIISVIMRKELVWLVTRNEWWGDCRNQKNSDPWSQWNEDHGMRPKTNEK